MNMVRIIICFIVGLSCLSRKSKCNVDTILEAKTKKCDCGVVDLRGRIIGGEMADEHEFPWQVAIFYFENVTCGGSLITDRHVLTAAHCYLGYDHAHKVDYQHDQEDITFVLGAHQAYGQNPSQHHKMCKPILTAIHPNYNKVTLSNDIALSEFITPVEKFSNRILPVCMPPIVDTFENVEATVTGWGTVDATVIMTSRWLMKANVMVFPNKLCRKLEPFVYDASIMICAAAMNKDACRGDSGGPLITKFNYRYIQIGIVSSGKNCGIIEHPGIYTRVNQYKSWILYHTKNGTYCESSE